MRGKDIPLETWYKITDDGVRSFKKPKYILQTTEKIKAEQDKLGANAGWYYGTWCNRCCGVYPAYMTDGGFKDYGYYVCLVCGKESLHEPMPWQSRDDWNAGRYKWEPPRYEQMTIFDWIQEG